MVRKGNQGNKKPRQVQNKAISRSPAASTQSFPASNAVKPTVESALSALNLGSDGVWYQLVDQRGENYKGLYAGFLDCNSSLTVSVFLGLVKAASPNVLANIDVLQLVVYANMKALKAGAKLKGSSSIKGLGASEEDPLIVKVRDVLLPTQPASSQDDTLKLGKADAEAFLESCIDWANMNCLETFDTSNSILKIDMKAVDGVINPLFSEQFYADEKDIGLQWPVDKLIAIKENLIVLLGVSGCGKTRTCFDICKRMWGLYFDCSSDDDFLEMKLLLQKAVPPSFKEELSQMEFESRSIHLIRCLIAARFFVLRALMKRNPDLKYAEWLIFQRLGQRILESVFLGMVRLDYLTFLSIQGELKSVFARNSRVLFDESQALLEVFKDQYRSYRMPQITEGKFECPRSFFSFLSRSIYLCGYKSVWCGTSMRIRNIELFETAMGGKTNENYLFTSFTYLKPSYIFKLLSKWLKIELEANYSILDQISRLLQGRPRFLASFLLRLIDYDNVSDCFLDYYHLMTSDRTYENEGVFQQISPYAIWKNRIVWTVTQEGNEAHKVRSVSEILLELCVSYLFGDGSSVKFDPGLDLVCTGLVMINYTRDGWFGSMTEPIVVNAGLNYMKDKFPEWFNCISKDLISPLDVLDSDVGHPMELINLVPDFASFGKSIVDTYKEFVRKVQE